MAEWPTRGQSAPNFWDTQLKGYIDERAVTPESVEGNLPARLSEEGVEGTAAEAVRTSEARPSWAAEADVTKRFDPERGWYNVNPTTLARWIEARMRMQAGTGQAHIVVLGDSTWQANGVYPAHVHATPGKIKSKLMTALDVPSGGTGIVVPFNNFDQPGNGSWSNPLEPRLKFYRDTSGGGSLRFSPGGEGLYTTGAVVTEDPGSQTNALFFEPGISYDDLWIYSMEAGGQSVVADMGAGTNVPADTSAYYSIRPSSDSAAAPLIGTVITPLSGYQRDPAGIQGGQRVSYIAVGGGTHNFRLMDDLGMGAGSSYYLGVEARIANAGLRVSNLAQSGRALENLFQNGNDVNGLSGYILGTDMAKPDLLIVGLMLNDYQASISPEVFKNRLTVLVQRAKATGATGVHGNGTGADASVMIVCSAQPDSDWPPVAPSTEYTDYLRAAYEVATEQDVALIDTAYRWVDYATSAPFMSDDVHPNDHGAEDIAGSIVSALVGTPSAQSLPAAIAKQGGLEVADVFTGKPNGDVVALPTGQAYRLWPTSGDRKPRIVNGKLTFAATAVAGGYASVDLVQPCTHADMFFTLGPYTIDGGCACLAAMESDIGASYDASLGVPRSPAHLIVSPLGWSFGVFDTHGGTLRVIKSGTYPSGTPLTADSTKVHYAAFDLDRENGTAYLSIPHPDGTQRTVVVTDPAIKIPAYSVFIEPFKDAGSVEQSLASFVAWNAHSSTTQTLGPAKERAASAVRTTMVKHLDQPGAIGLSQGSLTPIDATNARVSGRYGPTGGVIVTLSAFFVVQASADLYVCLRSGSDIVGESSTRVLAPRLNDTSQWLMVDMPVTTGVPHDAFDLMVSAGSFGGSAAIEGGSNYHITIMTTPF